MVVALGVAHEARAQMATLSGVVVDESDLAVPGADVVITQDTTGLQRRTTSDARGRFVAPLLPPGRYAVRAERAGLAPDERTGLVVGTNDQVTLRLRLRVAAVDQSVSVTAVAPKSIAPSTGRTIERGQIENLPLNGRSLHALLELTPGVVLFRSGAQTYDGQFAINGQRANANYFVVDGVSANVGINPRNALTGDSGAGAVPALSVLGTTTNLVGAEALEEFQMQTSSVAPEFGRSPGGQVSMTTRAGTNRFSGSAFEYFRDDAFDANDWFANARRLPKPPLRQHDLGGSLGGPLLRDRTFFFVAHESLVLDQPQTVVAAVPSEAARAAAPASTRPLLDAFPRPTGADLGAGTAEFAASYADSATTHATSLRLDTRHANTSLFGRAMWAPSTATTRTLNRLAEVEADTAAVTFGGTQVAGSSLFVDVRANWTRATGATANRTDDFGGAVPLETRRLFPGFMDPSRDSGIVSIGTLTYRDGQQADNEQRQVNLVASVSTAWRGHMVKAGIDARRMAPRIASNGTFQVVFANIAQASAGTATQAVVNVGATPREGRLDNWSAFLQDVWQVGPRLTLTYGLRWELARPPDEVTGQSPATVVGYRDQAAMALAPASTPVWDLGAGAVAPRLGAAYQLSRVPGRELTVRGGAGLFHTTLLGPVGNVYGVFPYSRQQILRTVTYPAVLDGLVAPVVDRSPPYGQLWAYSDDLTLPRTWQANVTFEHALGPHQTLVASYVGARGDALLRTAQILANPSVNPLFGSVVNLVDNTGRSRYHALQLQWTRRMHRQWSGLASYTWSTSRDNTSADSSTVAGQTSGTAAPGNRLDPDGDWGASDFDVRHVFSAGLSWQAPSLGRGVLGRVASDWGLDLLVRARSALPITVVTAVDLGFGFYNVRPDRVDGASPWIDDATVGGGRRVNRAAFTTPVGRQGTMPRNDLRGFAAGQADLALRRTVIVGGGVRLTARVDAFNVLNRPLFADPPPNLASPQFGTTTQTLSRGLGGLSPLFQMGGPRSLQFSLRAAF